VEVKLNDADREREGAKAKGKGKDKGKTEDSGKGDSGSSGRAIYASGFDYGTEEAALEKHFGDVGTIESIHFRSKGAAALTFVEAASAQRAVTELDGTTMTGQTRYVSVKLDNPLHKRSNTAGQEGKAVSQTTVSELS